MRISRELVERIEAAAAADGAAVVAAMRQLEPDSPAQAIALGGGQLVLLGPGMYINRAIGLGLQGAVTVEMVQTIERASAAVGVPAEVEVCPLADPSLLGSLARRGYDASSFRSVLVRELVQRPVSTDDDLVLSAVRDEAGLQRWQETSARAFELQTPEQRDISGRFSAAWYRVPGETLYLAEVDGRAVACAALTLRGGVATLGGMSTLPESRRRGVQRALLARRLADAVSSGCDVAISTAAPGSASERNLLRAGFVRAYTQLTVQRG